jgi:hypothetical protein
MSFIEFSAHESLTIIIIIIIIINIVLYFNVGEPVVHYIYFPFNPNICSEY